MRDYALGTTFDLKFTTRRFTTGVPFTLAGSPAVVAYPDNSTTEITAGITLSVDFDSRTGLNNVRVVATSGNGYAAGSNYSLVISSGTVDSVSVVGEVIGEFSLEAQSPLRPTTTGRTLDVTATGGAGIDWSNVEAPTTTLNLSGTTIATTQKVDVETIKTNPVVNAGTITFPTTATLASTTNITAGTVTTATNVTTVNGLAANVITATSIQADAITAAKVADGTIDAATFAAGAIDAAAIANNAIDRATFAADTGLQTIRSNTAQSATGTTIVLDASASAVDNFYNNDIVYITGGTGVGQARFITAYVGATKTATVATWATNPDVTSTFAILPFDAVAGASAPTAAQVATAVWQDTTAGDFTTAGSIGKSLFTGGAVPGAAGGVFIAGSNAATTVNITGNLTGNVSGSVGSVTGNVGGNVVGDVGGNVTGSVGSVAAGGITASSIATGAVDADAIATDAINEIADGILNRDISVGTDSGSTTFRTLRQAIRFLRNKWAISTGTLTVYKEDDSTASWTAAVSTDPAAEPIVSNDPAGP